MSAMNSNPFRKQAPITTDRRDSSAEPVPVPAFSEFGVPVDLELPPKPPSTAKKVRISSPPRSPPPDPSTPIEPNSLALRAARSRHDGLPPPLLANTIVGEVDTGRDDPFDRASSTEDEERSTDTEQMSGSITGFGLASKAPPNPFSRTLATMEEPLRSSILQEQEQAEGLAGPSNTEKAIPRASMDVNAFKNLLMTGKATPSGHSGSLQPKSQSVILADNSSSTDTSSISRQSLSEPVQETPRTSYEQSVSEDDEGARLIQERKKAERIKPPPPRRRHGKALPVQPKGPQIVSFADFTPSFSPTRAQTLPITISQASPTSPTLSKSNLNKPLPPPPRPSSVASTDVDKEAKSPRRSLDHPSDVSEPTSPRRIPPAPPLARRSSQFRPNNPPPSRSRSSTQTSNRSLKEEKESTPSHPEIAIENSSSPNKMAPPPPPTRRPGVSHNSSNTPISPPLEGSPLSLSRTSSLKSPPPPPARNRSLSALSSPSSTTSSVMSPPPPPPPRRTSSKGSFDMASPTGSRRVSQEVGRPSLDSERGASLVTAVKDMPISEETTIDISDKLDDMREMGQGLKMEADSKDVLADMEALQREIDDLMKKDPRTS